MQLVPPIASREIFSHESGRKKPFPDRKPKALFIVDAPSFELIYPAPIREQLSELADFLAEPQTRESIQGNPHLLAGVEVMFSGWGAPIMNADFVAAAPGLKAVFYGAGSILYCTSEAFWERGIMITSGYAANAVPVAEYTLGVILLSLKNFWRSATEARAGKGWGNQTRHIAGCFRSTVALIGCGMIARKLIALLRQFDLKCIVYDPYISESDAERLGVELCSLEEAFRLGDVVSLHAPSKTETDGMITGRLISLMKSGGVFVNTSRGQLVREEELAAVLSRRPDLTAVLDVVNVEPPSVNSPFFALPNLIYTPHIAGSHGPECERLGQYMVDEFRRYLAGEPLRWQITREMAAQNA